MCGCVCVYVCTYVSVAHVCVYAQAWVWESLHVCMKHLYPVPRQVINTVLQNLLTITPVAQWYLSYSWTDYIIMKTKRHYVNRRFFFFLRQHFKFVFALLNFHSKCSTVKTAHSKVFVFKSLWQCTMMITALLRKHKNQQTNKKTYKQSHLFWTCIWQTHAVPFSLSITANNHALKEHVSVFFVTHCIITGYQQSNSLRQDGSRGFSWRNASLSLGHCWQYERLTAKEFPVHSLQGGTPVLDTKLFSHSSEHMRETENINDVENEFNVPIALSAFRDNII